MRHTTLGLLACALSLAPTAAAQVGYAVDSNLDELYSVDLTTGAVTLIASTLNNGLDTPAGLAWRDDISELWTIDLGGGEVGPIDVTTGTFTPVLQTNLNGWQGIAWDPARSVFLLANQDDNNYELDPVTGVTTLLGNSGFGLITAMDFDGAGVLWGIDFSGAIVQIDVATGVGTQTGTTSANIQGLAIDGNGTWYGANTTDDSLYIIDPMTGAAQLVGPMTGLQFVKGFEIPTMGGNTPIGTNYCTANANSTGVIGRISAFGSRVVANNDVTLEARDLPLSSFLFFLTSTTTGIVMNPGGSQGNLCLSGSIGRYVGPGQILNSGALGTASLALDLNQTPTPTGFVSVMVGESRSFQAWYRDVSGGVATSNFTDGTTVTFQ